MSWDNLTSLLNAAVIDTFEAVATVAGQSLRGEFKNAFFDHPSGSAGHEGSVPIFGCDQTAANVLSVARGTVMTIKSTNYRVVGYEPGDDGWLLLILEEA